ncbi:hypothetical protein WJX82_010578 [Trebouxia sp. C0006]
MPGGSDFLWDFRHNAHTHASCCGRLKLSTLVDLISALQARGPCAFAIVCSGRDVLDKPVTGFNQVKDLSVAYLTWIKHKGT